MLVTNSSYEQECHIGTRMSDTNIDKLALIIRKKQLAEENLKILNSSLQSSQKRFDRIVADLKDLQREYKEIYRAKIVSLSSIADYRLTISLLREQMMKCENELVVAKKTLVNEQLSLKSIEEEINTLSKAIALKGSLIPFQKYIK